MRLFTLLLLCAAGQRDFSPGLLQEPAQVGHFICPSAYFGLQLALAGSQIFQLTLDF